MRIAFLAPANSIHSRRWIDFFAKGVHQIDWISTMPPAFALPDRLTFHLLKSGPLPTRFLGWGMQARRLLKSIKPDLMHVHSLGTYGALALLAASRSTKIVATGWGSDVVFNRHHPVKRHLLKAILQRADLLTCDAEHMKRAMLELGADAAKVEIVMFGVDTRLFSKKDGAARIKADLGVGDAPTVVSLRSFEPVYDLSTLIRAMPLILAKVPNAQFLLFGRGSQADELRRLVAELKLERHVKFPGFIQNDMLPELLSAMDVYVSTSLSDAGLASSTQEAMACETSVVVTDSGENGLWIDDGKNGFIVPVTSPEPLAERIINLLQDAALRRTVGTAGRGTIRARTDYETEMGRMQDLYQAMLT